MFNNSLNKMCGRIAPGMCRLSMNGIAIKTSNGYKVYDVNTGGLVNCGDFVFDIGDDIFFMFPTNVVNRGDIILSNGKPVCVINATPGQIQAFRYEDSSIITIVPENFVFFGATYFYSKVVSLFGDMSGGMDMQKIMPMMFMSEMMKGDSGSGSSFGGKSKFSEMLPFVMMMNSGFNFNNMFGGMFNTPNTASTTPTTPTATMVDKQE